MRNTSGVDGDVVTFGSDQLCSTAAIRVVLVPDLSGVVAGKQRRVRASLAAEVWLRIGALMSKVR